MRRFSGSKNRLTVNIFRIIFYIPQFAKLYFKVFKDKRTPVYLKLMLVFALIYFISPLDIIPELINPFIGIVDDALLLFLAFKYFIKLAPRDVVAEHVNRIGSIK